MSRHAFSAVDDEKLPIGKDDEFAHGSAVQHVIVLLVPTGWTILRLGVRRWQSFDAAISQK